MVSKIINPKLLHKNNKINIMFKLLLEGDKSRLRLAAELGLTPASISQITGKLIAQGLLSEGSSVQRNSTGRKEVLLHFEESAYGAVGINIEKDKTHISICTYNNVLEQKTFDTKKLLDNNLELLLREIRLLIASKPEKLTLLGIGVGISGKVDKDSGVSIDSYGILPLGFPLLARLKEGLNSRDICVINNVKAQARALIQSKEDNFMFIKHSPGIGCALITGGEAEEGYNNAAGEIGHTVAMPFGRLCACGRRGCLETVASDKAIEEAYFEKTGQKKEIGQIYSAYGSEEAATGVISALIERLAIAIGNAAALYDPKLVIVTGGVFSQSGITGDFYKKLKELGYGRLEIKNIGNEKNIKALAGARYILLEKLFKV